MLQMLRAQPLFEGLDDDLLSPLMVHSVLRTYKKKSIVVNQDDETDSVYFICEGRVRAFRNDERGQEITLNILKAGDYFGEFALLDDRPRVASIETLDQTVAIAVSKGGFMQCFSDSALIAWRLARNLVQKVRNATLDCSNLALLDVYGRVAGVLLKSAEKADDGLSVVSGITHQDIANQVGASREMVSRIMQDMRSGGYVRNDGRKIIILRDL